MEAKQNNKMQKPDEVQNIIMESRKKITVSGVEDIESFNEQQIVLHTVCGVAVIDGANMHIQKLSIEGGETVITGDIDSVVYHDKHSGRDKRSFISRLFR